MVATVHPITTTADDSPATTTHDKSKAIKAETESLISGGDGSTSSSFNARSIKFCLIMLISGLVVLSVIVLSGTWLASFGPAITKSSNAERDSELRSIINYIDTTFKELVMSSVNIKQQLLGDQVNPYNLIVTERKTFSGYKSVKRNHDGMVVSSYIGDPHNNCFGTIDWGTGSALFNITPIDQKIYYCKDWQDTIFCNRSSTPDEVTGSFDVTVLMDQCKDTPNAMSYTPSYADPAMPQFVFISLINCVADSLTNQFWYYYGMDLTTGSISDFLQKKVKQLEGSKSFIVETSTEYLIAVDSSVSISKWGDGHVLEREKANTIKDSAINSLALTTQKIHKKWSDFKCNEIEVTTSETDYVSVYRFCTDTKLDWVIVLSIPQWKYIGSTIIAVIASLVGSILIVAIGIVLGVVVAVKIVKPFRNLMDLFESVANMDLDNIQVNPSYFSEVKSLQKHFLLMVKQIKLYRSFIPAHILSELDNQSGEENGGGENTNGDGMPRGNGDSMVSKSSATERSSFESGVNSHGSKMDLNNHHHSSHKHSSSKKKYNKDINRFALYLEDRTFSVILLRMKGLDELLGNIDYVHVTKILSEMFQVVNSSSKLFGVHVSGLENDSVYISINASSNQANHEEKAAKLARLLEENLLKVKYTKWKQMDSFKKKPLLLDELCFRMAIHSVQSCCGNVGTDDSKVFTILGSGKYNMSPMIEMADGLGISIVCSEKIKQKIDSAFQTRFLDFQQFASDSVVHSNLRNEEFDRRVSIYELGISNHVEGDEWMYELEAKEKKQKWTAYNEGVVHYLAGEVGLALEKFREQLQKDSNDNATQRMIEKLDQHLHSQK